VIDKLSVATFTNLGFLAHSLLFDPVEADMTGKTVVITGATGGLGRRAAVTLAGMGARVIVVGRTETNLEETVDEVGSLAIPVRADLSLMSEVCRLAERLQQEERIDVLINNVGVLLPERGVTSEGIERTLAINLAGHFLLTNRMIPKMVEAGSGRIVNVSSGGMYAERIRPDDLQYERGTYRGSVAYARTKRGQVILTEMWAEKLAGSGVVVHALHPGWVETAGVAESLPTFNRVMKPFLRTVEQGADTMVWLAAADEPTRSSGEFWFDRRVVPTHLLAKTRETPEEREALWERLEELTGPWRVPATSSEFGSGDESQS
jgi:dehydrogenase/reductase SDR family member 12